MTLQWPTEVLEMTHDSANLPTHNANCLFCKIVNHQIPCHSVYEDADIIAFLDIGPIVRGHTLVVPKYHTTNYLDCPPAVAAKLASVTSQICRGVMAATGAEACHLLVNNGAAAMQSVMHLHQHILPRFIGDGFTLPWPAKKLADADVATLVGAIRGQLAR